MEPENRKSLWDWGLGLLFVVLIINSFVTTCSSTRALDKVEEVKKELPKDGPTVINNVEVEQNCMLWGDCTGSNSNSEIGSPKDNQDDNWPWR